MSFDRQFQDVVKIYFYKCGNVHIVISLLQKKKAVKTKN